MKHMRVIAVLIHSLTLNVLINCAGFINESVIINEADKKLFWKVK